jgi:hypothetical protein
MRWVVSGSREESVRMKGAHFEKSGREKHKARLKMERPQPLQQLLEWQTWL